jgi:hypothetical protein
MWSVKTSSKIKLRKEEEIKKNLIRDRKEERKLY